MAVAAGSVALPTLLKLADVMNASRKELAIGEQLPMPVELGSVRPDFCALFNRNHHALHVLPSNPPTPARAANLSPAWSLYLCWPLIDVHCLIQHM